MTSDKFKKVDQREQEMPFLDKNGRSDDKFSKSKNNGGDFLFETKMQQYSASCISKIFAFWVRPLIDFVNSGKRLKIESFGELADSQKVQVQLNLLESAWNQRKHL